MALLTVYQSGITAGVAPRPKFDAYSDSAYEDYRDALPSFDEDTGEITDDEFATADQQDGAETKPAVKRSTIDGWSMDAARRNKVFLYSIDPSQLTGQGYAYTLTLRDCPPTVDAWKELLSRFWKRVMRTKPTRLHWCVEYTRRHVPHLHCVIYWSQDHYQSASLPVDAWLDLSREYRTLRNGQCVKPVASALGWFQYTAKHSGRGAAHYQRSPDAAPRQWTSTGRLWGHRGDWPKGEMPRFFLPNETYYRYRRLHRAMRRANARQPSRDGYISGKRIRSARRCLRCTDPDKSRVRGVSEWSPRETQMRLLQHLGELGHYWAIEGTPLAEQIQARARDLRYVFEFLGDEHRQQWDEFQQVHEVTCRPIHKKIAKKHEKPRFAPDGMIIEAL